MRGLTLSNVGKSFGAFKALQGIDLDLAAGEHVTVFGPSGCGKSLLLRLIAGVHEPDEGDIRIAGRSVLGLGPDQRGVGMAFQTFALYPHMSAEANIASPLLARRAGGVDEAVRRIARLLKIEHVLGHRPRELSNGQKQRTALSRALVAEPKLLLLDDPLRNVDAKLRYEMRLELPRLLRGFDATVLYVTQDYREAMALGERIAVMLGGRLAQLAPPTEIYDAPVNLDVARLFGDPTINVIETEVRGHRATIAGAAVDLSRYSLADGTRVRLGIRPEDARLAAGGDGPGIAAELLAVSPLNERVVFFCRLADGHEFMASAPVVEAAGLAPGPVRIALAPERILLFSETGARIAPEEARP